MTSGVLTWAWYPLPPENVMCTWSSEKPRSPSRKESTRLIISLLICSSISAYVMLAAPSRWSASRSKMSSAPIHSFSSMVGASGLR